MARLTWLAVVVVVVVVASACSDGKPQLKWRAHEMTSSPVGPFTIEHPMGWRDLEESEDPSLARIARRAGPNAHILVPERASNTDTNIAFDWNEDMPNFRNVTCVEFAQGLAAASPTPAGPVTDVMFGADRGCTWSSRDGDSQVTAYTRFRGDSFLTLACMRPVAGDAAADAACSTVVAALKTQE